MDQEISSQLPDAEPSEGQPLASSQDVHRPHGEAAHEGEGEKHASTLPPEFLAKIEPLGTPEEKLDCTLALMQEILEGGGTHQFRQFWEARRLCLELFQPPIHPTSRVRLWMRYSELCREARRLKELFEEQSSFVTEQVEMAIDAVEDEFSSLEVKLTAMPEIEALRACKSIAGHIDQYQALQHELNYLNSFASRITSLRKEVLKTDIRYKQKARLLQRLRVLGDWVYPRRKQAIHDVSELFLADVASFIQKTFVGELKTHELVAAREEIKTLQTIGKLLTLSTDAFTRTRLQLSESWDSIKTVLKEKKKAQSEQRQAFRFHRETIEGEIERVRAAIEGGTLKVSDGQKELRTIDTHMRSLSLGHQDVRTLREKLGEIETLIEQKGGADKKPARQEWQEQKAKAHELCVRAEAIIDKSSEVFEVEEAFDNLLHASNKQSLSKSDRLEFDRLCSKIRGKIETLRAERLSSLAGDEEREEERAALDDMRSSIKEQLEVWRKASGGFGCDFSEALRYQELAEEEKARLERIQAMIAELDRSSTPESCP